MWREAAAITWPSQGTGTANTRGCSGSGQIPQRWAAGGCDARWRGRLTEAAQDGAHGRALGDFGDDPYRCATEGAQQRQDFGDAGEQQRRGVVATYERNAIEDNHEQ